MFKLTKKKKRKSDLIALMVNYTQSFYMMNY